MAKVATVKNISRGNFFLSLHQITPNKRFDLKPNSEVPLNEDELAYLMNDCQGAFRKGYLEIIKVDDKVKENIDIIKTENKLSEEGIDALLDLAPSKMKTKLAKIDASHLLKEIRQKAEELNKSNKVMEAIDARIKEVADGLVL